MYTMHSGYPFLLPFYFHTAPWFLGIKIEILFCHYGMIMCMCPRVCMYICMHICVLSCMCMCGCMCISVHVFVYVCVHANMCAYLCGCMCICMSVLRDGVVVMTEESRICSVLRNQTLSCNLLGPPNSYAQFVSQLILSC